MLTSRRSFLQQTGLIATGIGLSNLFLPQPEWAFGSEQALPVSTPEAQGVSSKAILEFLDAVEKSVHEFHGLVIMRHGKVITEGYWWPYRANLNHSMYSMSKSFTSTAIGFAVAEKRLSVEDQVISFFPDKTPAAPSANLKDMQIKHLLSMSVGHATDTTWEMVRTDDWVKSFLSYSVEKEPGSEFLYNSGATYMLSAIIQKVTGQTVLEWLTPRLFAPLGIKGATWDLDPSGICTGGWGAHLKTGDLAKFGQLYLQKGKWNDKQILPAEWVEAATTFKIQNGRPEDKATSDWAQGYCYQFWRCRHNAYRGDGAFGQYTVVIPEHDAVVAITEETPDLQGVLDLLWKHLLPAMQPAALPADAEASERLKQKLADLRIDPPEGKASSPMAAKLRSISYRVEPNDNRIDQLSFNFSDKSCFLHLHNHLGKFSIFCGINRWARSSTSLPGTPPDLFPIPYEKLHKSQTMGSGVWTDDNTFVITLQYFETAHHDTITCRFEGDTVRVSFLNSVSELIDWVKEHRVELHGKKI